jgi:hypothetical protein
MSTPALDQMRSDMMNALYERSGRTCCTYSGLWQEFAQSVAVNFRDTDYPELLAACIAAIGETQSHLAEKHAMQCIAVCRQYLLGEWA